jgi:ectoine hydroxylase-related dioxygenase (phytanoyl-CoA dioxygenase family)
LRNNINNVSSSIIHSDVNPDFNKNDITTYDIQNLHMDFKRFSKKIISDKKFPLSVLIALEEDTVLRVLLNSHKLSKNCTLKTLEVLLNLKKGQILIFHPNLVHSGWNFLKANIRLHFYLDNYKLYRRKKETDAWYTDNIYLTKATRAKENSLCNLKSFNNNKKLKFNRLDNFKIKSK